jgi:hypothetical protein
MLKTLLTLTGLLLSSLTSYAESIKAPLHYQSDSGAYTMRVWVGCQPPQPIDAVADTGSANVNFLGNQKLCPNCLSDLNQPSLYTPSVCATAYQDYFNMFYGIGNGRLRIYHDDLRLSPSGKAIPLNFSIYTQGQHINNVIGLAYDTIAEPKEYPLLPFLPVLEKAYQLAPILSLKLCDQRDGSQLGIGASLLSPETARGWQYTPIVRKDFYTVLLQGISDKNSQKSVIHFGPSQMNQLSVLDSGTMGLIILSPQEANKIKQYLQNYYQQQTGQALPQAFWQQNECIDKRAINFSAFPTLQIHLAKWDHPGETIALDLSPERYLNMGGCGNGFVRLAFMGQDTYQASNKSFKDPSKVTPLNRQLKIIGTPLFENYIVTIYRGETYNTTSHYDAKVGFYPSASFCHK